jgi:hypothetical protein
MEEVRQDTVFIGRADQVLHRQPHHLRVERGQEIAEIPDGDAEELRATLDDVRDVTNSGYFEKKD